MSWSVKSLRQRLQKKGWSLKLLGGTYVLRDATGKTLGMGTMTSCANIARYYQVIS